MNRIIRSRVRGAIVGTAIGDALGMPAEGMTPQAIAQMYGRLRSFANPKGGTWAHTHHQLGRGQWTDDTQLMLAIGESLLAKKHVDFRDIADRHISAMAEKRGWGGSTVTGVSKIRAGVNWWNSAKPEGAGNGTPMKIAAVGAVAGLGFLKPFDMASTVINISRMTHGDPRSAIAGIIQAEAIAIAIKGGPAALRLYLAQADQRAESWERCVGSQAPLLSANMSAGQSIIMRGGDLENLRSALRAGCFVVQSFPFTISAVLLMFDLPPDECLSRIVEQGGDTDTTGAMAGAVLGAAHGMASFPARLRRGLEGYKRLIALADGLCAMTDMSERPCVSGKSFSRPKISFSRGNEKPKTCQPLADLALSAEGM